MADFKNGMTAVQLVKDLMHPPRYPSSHIYKASDAFAPYADKNIVVGVTQADRTVAQPNGRLKGGPLFSMLGEVDPAYKGKVWGHDSAGHAQGLLNGFEVNPADTMLMTTILGGPLMQGSNSEIFKRTSKAYRDAIKDNKLLPEHLNKTNEVVRGLTADNIGTPLFDAASDVTDPAFWKNLTTFQQRRAMNDIMGGYGVGGPKSGGAIFDWQSIMDKTTEPTVRNAPSSSIGPRIWTLNGTKEYSPHLNKAYPDIVGGVDQGINFSPVPYQDFLKDFTDNFMQTKNRVPNWKNLTMGHPKTQEITDQWLQHLKNTGNAEGGLIKGMADGGTPPAASMDGDQFFQAAIKAGLSTDIGSLNKIVDLVNKGMSISEAIEALTGQTHKRDGGQVEHMQHGGIMPRAGVYYPTSNDERNQAAGLPADFYRKGMTDVASHGYHVGVDVPAGDARLTADLMGGRYVSPQMTRDAINALRLGAEFPVGEGMLRAEVMKGLIPNVPTNFGLRYSRPFAEGGSVEHMQSGGLKTLFGEILNKGGAYAARRLERAADEIPNLEKLYQQEALRRAFMGDNAEALMTIKPSEFENYAAPLTTTLSKESKKNIANLQNIQGSGGFSDVPFLYINKEKQGSLDLPWITTHEGRHRNRAMDAAGEQAGLVSLLPRRELREPFPRRSQEQYIEALKKEMDLTGNKVKPEKYYDANDQAFERPAIDLPDLYAEGGAVHMQMGGMTPEPPGGTARQETFASQHVKDGGDIMRSLFDHALDKGDIHEMTHAMLVKQHEAEYG